VPVACDASGRLLLEEQGQGPQGEQGPPGPKGEDGDPFSGNFAGDVTFDGSAEFVGELQVSEDGNSAIYVGRKEAFESRPTSDNENGTRLFANSISVSRSTDGVVFQGRKPANTAAGSNDWTSTIYADGSAEFNSTVTSGTIDNAKNYAYLDNGLLQVNRIDEAAAFYVTYSGSPKITLKGDGSASFAGNVDLNGISSSNSIVVNRTGGTQTAYQANLNGVKKAEIKADGLATFAGGKAGFTAEGYLWCTTVRGDTVMLDATSNGMGVWVEYSPTTLIDEIRDRLDANRGDTGEMPADTP
jgi:hypothetical protein